MISRILGRLVTGPLAFFVAWVVDALVLVGRLLASRRRRP
jgi:hypothetical protein